MVWQSGIHPNIVRSRLNALVNDLSFDSGRSSWKMGKGKDGMGLER